MSIQYKLFAFSIRSLFTMVWCSPLPSRPFCHLHSPTYIIALQHSTNLYLLACITCASSFLWNFCTRSLSFSLIFRKSSPPPPSPLRCFSAFVFRVEKVFFPILVFVRFTIRNCFSVHLFVASARKVAISISKNHFRWKLWTRSTSSKSKWKKTAPIICESRIYFVVRWISFVSLLLFTLFFTQFVWLDSRSKKAIPFDWLLIGFC